MPTLIGFKTCHHFNRIAVFLSAKRVKFDMYFIKNGAHSYFDNYSSNSFPIFVTQSGNLISDPIAILEYLDEYYEKIEDDLDFEEKAYVRKWSNSGVTACDRLNKVFFIESEFEFYEQLKSLSVILNQAEIAIKSELYFQGMFLSNIDFSWVPFLLRTSVIYELTGIEILKHYPKLYLLRKELIDSNYSEKPTREELLVAFKKLLLSKNTFLGKKLIKSDKNTNLVKMVEK